MFDIIALLKEIFGFGNQIAKNKGARIPLTENEIRQRSERRALGIVQSVEEEKWISAVKFYNKQLKPSKSLHAKNQIRDLIRQGADIVSIDIQEREGKNWLVIMYMREDYKREYLIDVK